MVQAAPPSPPVPVAMANIARAQSGEVPNSAVKSPALGSQIQVAVVQFGRASSGVTGMGQEVIADVARMQKRNGGTVRVVAHASEDASAASVQGLEQANYDVSRRRALAIANMLMAYGVPRSSIVAEAASDAEPAYGTNTARGVAANRRAEIYLNF
jgi:outer membrane protein OmpA-like peptidoglycan-associated protein